MSARLPNAVALAGGLARLGGRGRPVGAGSILCFHSVADQPLDPGSPHVSPATLRMVIAAARRVGTIVPLREILARHRAGRSTRGMVAITFDDAYAALVAATEFLRT